MISFSQAMKTAALNRNGRSFPSKSDKRYRDGNLFPGFTPRFKLDFGRDLSVFTIGSCFARNIEASLETLGVRLPVAGFHVPKEEWPHRPSGILNEYTPGTMSQRIIDAMDDAASPVSTIVPSAKGYADLLLLHECSDVSLNRAEERRAEIHSLYGELKTCDVVILTLGYIEAWFDQDSNRYLNRVPPRAHAAAHPSRYIFKQLDISECYSLLERAVGTLTAKGIKVIITVSPVPLQSTFTDDDCVIANELSKSTLRTCADLLRKAFSGVDYFPSYEIVRSGGIATAYGDDNVHVNVHLIHQITKYMVESYSSGNERDLAMARSASG